MTLEIKCQTALLLGFRYWISLFHLNFFSKKTHTQNDNTTVELYFPVHITFLIKSLPPGKMNRKTDKKYKSILGKGVWTFCTVAYKVHNEYEYFYSYSGSLIFCWIMNTVVMCFPGPQVSCLTQTLKWAYRVRDNSITCSSHKDHAFWYSPPSPLHSKTRHRLKSTMTKWTAVDWGRGIEENQVPVHKLIPALPHHCSDKPLELSTDTGGRGDGNINASFIWAPHPASTAVWKHNCNENPIDWSRFLLDKLHCFPLPFNWSEGKCKEQRWKPWRHHCQCSIMKGRPSTNCSCRHTTPRFF